MSQQLLAPERTSTSVAPVPDQPPATLLEAVLRASADPRCDTTKMQALLDMRERLEQQQAKREFASAMMLAQSEMQPVVRDAQNDHTRSRYARLETIDAKIRPVYTRHGFSLTFNSNDSADGSVSVSCTVMHTGGFSRDYTLTGGLDSAGSQGKANKTPIQALGSTVSYLRRYLTLMIFNLQLTNEDNDGNRVVGYISEEQVSTIVNMLAACTEGLSEERHTRVTSDFLRWINAETVSEILASDYPKAMAALQQKLKKAREGK